MTSQFWYTFLAIYILFVPDESVTLDENFISVSLNDNTKDLLDYVIAGSSLHITCTMQVGIEYSSYSFNWETPRRSNTGTILDPVFGQISGNTRPVTSEYVVDDVTSEDEGRYTCHLKTDTKDLKRSGYVRIPDKTENMEEILERTPLVESNDRDEVAISIEMKLVVLFGIVCIIIIIIVMILVYCCVKMRRNQRMKKQSAEPSPMHFEEGAPERLQPGLTVNDRVDLLPYDRKWEFPRERLKLVKQLESGAFGVVYKAKAYGINPDEYETTVAVKTVRKHAESSYVKTLASELKVMMHLGKHLNVVNLLGACTNNILKNEPYVIVEYCRFGNLQNYLRRHRKSFIDQIDPTTGEINPLIDKQLLLNSSRSSERTFFRNIDPNTVSIAGLADVNGVNISHYQPEKRSSRGICKDKKHKPICTRHLLAWAFQVARGMEYLSKKKILHGDLAARNILLAENNVVKICDFGLARKMYIDNIYQKKADALMPVKWMAIESIRDRLFSTKSDVWSFGIVLWECFTLAETPYPGMKPERQYQRLVEGYRMEQPKYATRDLYEIMRQCWKAKPALRPSFTDLVEDIGFLLEDNVKKLYEDMNKPYVKMNMAKEAGKDYLTMSSPDPFTMSSHQDCVKDSVDDPEYLTVVGENPVERSQIFNPTYAFLRTATIGANSNNGRILAVKKDLQEIDLDDDHYLKPLKKKRKNM